MMNPKSDLKSDRAPRRVLHVVHSLVTGGIEMWLLKMLGAISRDDVAMDICCKGPVTGFLTETAKRHGAEVHHIPMDLSQVRFIHNFRNLLREHRYDIVHNHLDISGAPIAWSCRQERVPYVASIHNTAYPPHGSWARIPPFRQLRYLYGRVGIHYMLKHASAITGCSRAVLQQLCRTTETRQRGSTLYYGVPMVGRASDEERTSVRKEFGWSDSDRIVLHVGRFNPQKNHAGLLRIYSQVRKSAPSAKLLLVGDGPLQHQVREDANELGIDDSTYFAGIRQDVARLMSASDVFLFPSIHEGLGLVTVESCAAGLPVVGSDIPGHDETIVDGESGFLFPVNQESAMAERVIQLLSDEALAQRVSQAALARAQSHFSIDTASGNLRRLYDQLLGCRSRETQLCPRTPERHITTSCPTSESPVPYRLRLRETASRRRARVSSHSANTNH